MLYGLNVIWVIGGDTDPTILVESQVQAFVAALSTADSRHPITAHNGTNQMAVTPWPGATWFNINDVYTYSDHLYQSMLAAYSRIPTMLVFLIESGYENEPGSSISA